MPQPTDSIPPPTVVSPATSSVKRKLENMLSSCCTSSSHGITTTNDPDRANENHSNTATMMVITPPKKRARGSNNVRNDRRTSHPKVETVFKSSIPETEDDDDSSNPETTVKTPSSSSLWNSVLTQIKRCATAYLGVAGNASLTQHPTSGKMVVETTVQESSNEYEYHPSGTVVPVKNEKEESSGKNESSVQRRRRGKRDKRCGVDIGKATTKKLSNGSTTTRRRGVIIQGDDSVDQCLKQWFDAQAERMLREEMNSLESKPAEELEQKMVQAVGPSVVSVGKKNTGRSQQDAKSCLEQWFNVMAEQIMMEVESLESKPGKERGQEQKVANDKEQLSVVDENNAGQFQQESQQHVKTYLQQVFDAKAEQIMMEVESLECKPSEEPKQKLIQDVDQVKQMMMKKVKVKSLPVNPPEQKAVQDPTLPTMDEKNAAPPQLRVKPYESYVEEWRKLETCPQLSKYEKERKQKLIQDVDKVKQMMMKKVKVKSLPVNPPEQKAVQDPTLPTMDEKNAAPPQLRVKPYESYVEEWRKLETCPRLSKYEKERMMIVKMGLFSKDEKLCLKKQEKEPLLLPRDYLKKMDVATSTAVNVTTTTTVRKTGEKKKKDPSHSSSAVHPSKNSPLAKGLSEHAKSYLEQWFEAHASHPFPTKQQKDQIVIELGLMAKDVTKIESWFYRQRKKNRKGNNYCPTISSEKHGDAASTSSKSRGATNTDVDVTATSEGETLPDCEMKEAIQEYKAQSASLNSSPRKVHTSPVSKNNPEHKQAERIPLQTAALRGLLTREQAPGIGWTADEDARLTKCVKKHEVVDWEVIARKHGCNRTARECHIRWTRYLSQRGRKGHWREEEDVILFKAFAQSSETAFTQWGDLVPLLDGRSRKQIRERWLNYLNPSINHLPFSREDDLRLWEGHKKFGKCWVNISDKAFNSTRSQNQVKHRWRSEEFKEFIVNEFGRKAYS